MTEIMCLILTFVAIGIYIWARITINRCKNSKEYLEQLVNIKNDRIDDLRELASRECISSSCLFMALESLVIKDIEKSNMWMKKREALINELNINFNDPSKTKSWTLYTLS